MATVPMPDQTFLAAQSPSSQPQIKLQITPGNADMPYKAKAVTVHTQLGGRVRLVYIPFGNDAADVVDIYVPDGWVSDSMVRRVVSATAQGAGDTVTVWGLYN